MSEPADWRSELRGLLALGVPICIVQLGMRMMSTVDVLMVGQHSEHAFAAVSMGNPWVWFVTILFTGIVMAAEPLIAQSVGARDDAAISRHLQRGLLLVVLLAVPAMFLIDVLIEPVLRWTGQSGEVIPDAASYARIVALGALPMMGFTLLRSALQAFGAVRVIVLVIVVTNLVNALVNYALIFGNLGMPALGVQGSAWATAISRWLMMILLLWFGWARLGRHVVSFGDRELRQRALRPSALWRVIVIGLPIGLQISLELGVFAATTLTVGSLGTEPLNGHQVALDLASITFMVPMAFGMAASVRVGRAVGRGDMPAARRAAGVSLALIAAIESVFAVGFLGMPHLLAGLYTKFETITAIAAALLPIAGVFQVFDGLQAVAMGVLRGVGDTKTPMYASIVGFWFVGFPVGMWLTFEQELGAAGMWWGLVVGLGSVAVLLLAIARVKLRGEHTALEVD